GMVVFTIMGHRSTIVGLSSGGRASVAIPRLVCTVLLLLLVFHLFNVYQATYGEAQLRYNARQLVQSELRRFPGSSLVNVTIRSRFGPTSVFVVVKTPHPFTGAEVGQINDSLNALMGQPVELHMRSEWAVETTRDGRVASVAASEPIPSAGLSK